MERVWNGLRWLFVVVGVVLLTSFTIDATDSLRNSETALSGLVRNFSDTGCPAGMTELSYAGTSYCIDTYENSPAPDCPIAQPVTDLDTKNNLDSPDCTAVSVRAATPWTGVNFNQAKEACAKRGGRLPTAAEWYEAALGTPADTRCNISSGSAPTGSFDDCTSHRGTYDMVGNVWEWVDASVSDGQYNNRSLPAEGYVTGSDADGIATETEQQPSELYDEAYFWQSPSGQYVMMRGGFYGSAADASVYTTHAKVAPGFHSGAVGFRCITEM